MAIKLQDLMAIQYFCPLRVTCTKARSVVLGRTATTGLVRSAPALRTSPTTCTSIRTTWAGATTIAISDGLSVLSARRIYPLCATRSFRLVGRVAKSHNSSSYSVFLWNFYEMNGNFDLELVKAAVDVGGFWCEMLFVECYFA
jgi:hypothetical protein